jgi:N-acetylated-alpha-linked acidic dipeptidase
LFPTAALYNLHFIIITQIKAAEELGAVGLVMYSDPRDDGVVTMSNGYAPYPAGPARNPTAVQRGSVQYISVYPSDPGTPSTPAYENATRVEGWNTPNIPSLPLSWANTVRLLEEIGGTQEGRLLSGRVSERTIKLVNHCSCIFSSLWPFFITHLRCSGYQSHQNLQYNGSDPGSYFR